MVLLKFVESEILQPAKYFYLPDAQEGFIQMVVLLFKFSITSLNSSKVINCIVLVSLKINKRKPKSVTGPKAFQYV